MWLQFITKIIIYLFIIVTKIYIVSDWAWVYFAFLRAPPFAFFSQVPSLLHGVGLQPHPVVVRLSLTDRTRSPSTFLGHLLRGPISLQQLSIGLEEKDCSRSVQPPSSPLRLRSCLREAADGDRGSQHSRRCDTGTSRFISFFFFFFDMVFEMEP